MLAAKISSNAKVDFGFKGPLSKNDISIILTDFLT